MLTVACVLRRSPVYDDEYVYRLADGVREHLGVPHDFVCLSDAHVPSVGTRLLDHDWPGWWAKMELFRLPPPVLYFDLDTVITGDLSDIAEAKHPFTCLRDFYREKGFGSGMMAWSQDMTELYRKFASGSRDYINFYKTRGDQAFLEDFCPRPVKFWQDIVPGQVCSYKVHVTPQNCGVPQNCRVVCFHGKPKPRDVGWTI